MTALSSFLEASLAGHTLLGSSYTSPQTLWVSLATSMASDGLTFVEVPSGTAYTRQRWFGGPPVAGTVANTPAITYTAATTPWGGITHVGIYDSPTGGNQLFIGALTAVKTVTTGDTFQFPAGNLTVTFD